MKSTHIGFAAACLLGLSQLGPDASAHRPQTHAHEHDHTDRAFDAGDDLARLQRADRVGSVPSIRPGGVSVTEENQILVELAPGDTTPANLFDLNGRSLTFTPDGRGGYSRYVESVTWESSLGQAVADGAEVDLGGFTFDFAGRGWDSFFVSRRGVLTFGKPFVDVDPWDNTMLEIVADGFVSSPTISPLFKPFLGGRDDRFGATQHVAHLTDRVLVTWTTSEREYTQDGGATFQAVLHADGTIRFSYLDVTFGDGVVGLFPDEPVTKAGLIASISDDVDNALPAHLDITEAAIYESSASTVIAEFSVRGSIPEPDEGNWYSYRFHFDAEPPYFEGDSDLDMVWQIDVYAGFVRGHNGQVLSRKDPNRIALDVGPISGFSGMVRVGAAEFRGNRNTQGDGVDPTPIDLPAVSRGVGVDLSRSESRVSSHHSEVFHWRRVANTGAIACWIVEVLGDEFDLLTFHSEFRIDIQWAGMDWTKYGGNVRVEGIGVENVSLAVPPCKASRLRGTWSFPYWMHNVGLWGFDGDLAVFAHEFTHAWTAFLSYARNGEREGLFGPGCMCHWRGDLHLPAAFPWREGSSSSLMGGTFWRDNGDGTWTPLNDFHGSGHSWLDLYAMGLAYASEVPEMFILRDPRPVKKGDRGGPHTGDKEIITIEQVVAAEGPRVPSAADAQKDFNAGFVYLLEPGKTPDPEMLRLHSEFRHKALEHWFHITGGRSRMTSTVPSIGNRPPVAAAGTLADREARAGSTLEVDVEGLFLDADGDALTHEATSSAPAVAAVAVSGTTVTVTALTAGTTTITVTATDANGSNTSATLTFVVSVSDRASPLGDLNGDGRDDVLLRHRDGRWRYYPMDGQNPMRTGRGAAMLERDTQWRLAGIGDLDGDGREDVLLRHEDGRWLGYLMEGRTVRSSGSVPLPTDTAWAIAGLGDFDGDGSDDVLLRHEDGRWRLAPLVGLSLSPSGLLDVNFTRNRTWQVAGIGDLDGDSRDDVLLRHENGRWHYYPMRGARPGPGRGRVNMTSNLAWSLAGVGDMNGDGNDDALLRHNDGRWYHYPLSGRKILSGRGDVPLPRDLKWKLVGLGDLGGDGRADVLLRHDDGHWYYCGMSGRRIVEQGPSSLPRNPVWTTGVSPGDSYVPKTADDG